MSDGIAVVAHAMHVERVVVHCADGSGSDCKRCAGAVAGGGFHTRSSNHTSVQVVQGFNSQPIQLQVRGEGAFSGVVTTCNSVLVGVKCIFNNPTPSVTTSMPATVNTTVATPLGSGSVTISATVSGAPAPETQPLPITVTASGYAMTISNSPLKLLDGHSGTFNGTLTALNGYNRLINLTCLGGALPSPCTATSATPNGSGQPFSVIAGNTVAGNFSFGIQGVGTDLNSFPQTIPVPWS